MITGYNKKVDQKGLIQWWKPLISGNDLLAQDHTHRFETRQGSYRVDFEYGNQLHHTIIQGVSMRELNMRIQADIRAVTLQDGRIKECVVDMSSIEIQSGGAELTFEYKMIKNDGTSIDREYGK